MLEELTASNRSHPTSLVVFQLVTNLDSKLVSQLVDLQLANSLDAKSMSNHFSCLKTRKQLRRETNVILSLV
jgi:hypothetical protein